jgi:hypothetical protein
MRQSIRAELDEDLSGYVGSVGSKYAKVHLGGDTWVMTPKNAKHLWIPIADNLGGGGQMRMSPRAAMDVRTVTGKRALRIFKSKAGNLVAFLPEGHQASNVQTRETGLKLTNARYARGKNKGRQKGKLLFVLKDSVEVKGTNALELAVMDKLPRIGELLQAGVDRALSSDTGSSGGGAA